jgi:transposase-like protein
MARRPPPPADEGATGAPAPTPKKPAKPKPKTPAKRRRQTRKAQKKHRAQRKFQDPDGNPLCEPYRGKGIMGATFNKAYLRKVLREQGGPGGPSYELTDDGVEMIDEVLSAGGSILEVCEELGCTPHLLRRIRFDNKAVGALIEDARLFGVKVRMSYLSVQQPQDRDQAAALTAQVQAVQRYAELTLPHAYGRRAIDHAGQPDPEKNGSGTSGWAIVPQKQVAPAKAQINERLAAMREQRAEQPIEGTARLVLPAFIGPKGKHRG